MNSNEVKLKVKEFIKEFGLQNIDYASLKAVVEKQGYSVIEFNNLYNNQDVDLLIQSLGIATAVSQARGFTYADKNHRIVFINEKLSDEEKLHVIAHEEGHIFCGHVKSSIVIGKDVQEEYEANEFVHFLLNQTKAQRAGKWLKRHRVSVLIASIMMVAALVVAGLIVHHFDEEKYYGEYYITETGFKYHKKNCGYVKDKGTVHRMTKEEYESGKYEPCGVCLP